MTMRTMSDILTELGHQMAVSIDAPESDVPTRTWVTSIWELGTDSLILKQPLMISLEDYRGEEIVASWPEVEAWGSGATDFDAINSLKDEIVALYNDLAISADEELGELPRRWKRALLAAICKAD